MAFPKLKSELEAASYRYDGSKPCTGHECSAVIEWWVTPQGRRIPLDIDLAGNVNPHFATCVNAKDFRRKKPAAVIYK